MRRSRLSGILLAVGCVCVALLIAAALSQPKTSSNGVGVVEMSAASGFYDEPFYLELSSRSGRIYYTLDSSDPDEDDILYTGPILIEDASKNENVYCMNRDMALDLNQELIIKSGFTPKFSYELPSFPIDKATVVRAVCVDDDGKRSDIADAVYFVGYDQKTGYDGINIITVTTDPSNLFDPETGIYVLGNTFQNALVDGLFGIDPSIKYIYMPANYRFKGKEWERPASICFFDDTGRLIHSGNYGIRIQGHGARAQLPKSLNIFARAEYGETSIPCQELFGLDCELNKLNLSNCSNSVDSKLHDVLVNALCADLDFATREYEIYALFLDGEYWGICHLTPRYKADYLSYKFGVYGDNIVSYCSYDTRSRKNKRTQDNLGTTSQGHVEVGNPEDEELYKEMRLFICENDMTDPDNYARACELIDVQSCIDYYAVEIYIANNDWPLLNEALWRTRDVASGEYSDCRWRWLLFDVNIAMSNADIRADFVQRAINRDALFASLMDNESFSDAFYKKMVQLAEENFSPDKINQFIDHYEMTMVEPMDKHNHRYYDDTKTEEDFIDSCEAIRNFFLKRREYILSMYGTPEEQAAVEQAVGEETAEEEAAEERAAEDRVVEDQVAEGQE